jgi:hypothetical protein
MVWLRSTVVESDPAHDEHDEQHDQHDHQDSAEAVATVIHTPGLPAGDPENPC